jgi:GTP cyclohydrolase II
MRFRESPFASPPRLQETTLYLGRYSMPTRAVRVPITRPAPVGERVHRDGSEEFDVHFFHDLAHDRIAMAITCGDLQRDTPILARVHSSCLTSECLHGQDCDCADQLRAALGMMRDEGAGILFYLMQEGRGAGLTAKARDRMIVQASENQKTTFEAYLEMGLPADLRRYDVLAPMVCMLGLRAPLRLLTNNPDKAAAVIKVLADQDIRVDRTERIHGSTSPFNADYLMAKHDSGHAFAPQCEVAGALPPMPVRVVAPIALPGDRHRVLTASYFLPIAFPAIPPGSMPETFDSDFSRPFASGDGGDGGDGAVDWVRLSVIFDGESARESVLLSHWKTSFEEIESQASLDETEIEVITLSLLDRLPLAVSPRQVELGEVLTRIRDVGQGSVAIRFDDRARLTTDSLGEEPKGEASSRGRSSLGHRVAG